MTKWKAFYGQVSVTDKDLGDKSLLIAIWEKQVCRQSEKIRPWIPPNAQAKRCPIAPAPKKYALTTE
ncbi:hypothetical protein NQ774_15200 [Ochrobactrum sp. BD61]